MSPATSETSPSSRGQVAGQAVEVDAQPGGIVRPSPGRPGRSPARSANRRSRRWPCRGFRSCCGTAAGRRSPGAMALEHHHDAAGGPVPRPPVRRARFRACGRSAGPIAGVGREDPRAARPAEHFRLRRQGVQGVGIDDHRPGDLLVQPADEAVQFGRAAQPRPAGDHRSRLGQFGDAVEAAAAMRPSSSSAAGRSCRRVP